MQDELTEKQHSEFSVDEETEILHRCIYFWAYSGADENAPNFAEICESRGLTTEQVLKHKEYCLTLKNQ